MRRRSRIALGAGTFALVACYATLLTSLTLAWITTAASGYGSVGGDGAQLGYGSLYLGLLLTPVLLVAYVIIVLLREDWSWPRRALWAVSFWAAAPVTMPMYYVRHILRREG